ncbi:MAG: preprotein translocase subunit SecA [Candidatus Latescibacterota bacterium]|nr:MAG: preprotein translocase subunit SecA [Candidatus Latescibacterota bacterium]
MKKGFLAKIFGSKSERDFKKHRNILLEVNRYAEEYSGYTKSDFAKKTEELKSRVRDGEPFDALLPEAYGLVKTACKHLVGQSWNVCGIDVRWEMIPYDVQIVGGIALNSGSIAEMATGEGKTLVATMPLYLNALAGRGVHLITVNDYLARRDAEWMGQVYELLGLTVGCIQGDMGNEERKAAYAADITYGTNNEFGFDYLRDNMKTRLEDRVQRPHHYAIVDEVDSVLIDEARTPLIISGPVTASQSSELYRRLRPKVEKVVRLQDRLVNSLLSLAEKNIENAEMEDEVAQALLKVSRGSPKNTRFLKIKKESGIDRMISRMEADLMREKRLHELDEQLFYAVDEKGSTLNLTDKGREALAPEDREQFVLPDVSEEIKQIDDDSAVNPADKIKKKDELYRRYAEKSDAIHNFNQLLKAFTLFEKDVEYVVQDGRVIIVDEFTGRLMPGRRFSDGLHQALEAKEGVKIEGETQTLATITLQNYFRMYEKLAGMTGTAATEAAEFHKIYKLDVSEVPTNEPVRRIDFNDRIYRTKREKYNAIVEEIVRLHENGLPVLVGTVSVEVSELLSRLLKRRGIKHNVLNAKYHQKEAEIVATAGKSRAVTIATNMAGRGTDIKLEPSVIKCEACGIGSGTSSWETLDGHNVDPKECERDVPCGLHIIGTERHEARRIDRQLRGRSGRQGDPGSSLFFLSLEDDLMRLFGSGRVSGVMDRMGLEEGEVITHQLVTRAIEKAQQRVENYNFDIRKRLIDYDDVMNRQREAIYGRRDEIIEATDLKDIIVTMIDDVVETMVNEYIDPKELPENWPLAELFAALENTFLFSFPMLDGDVQDITDDDVKNHAQTCARNALDARERFLGENLGNEKIVKEFEKYVLLQTIDEKWMDHLHELDYLKEGIHFRAYAQKNPLIEYKKEAFGLFAELNETIDRDALHAFFHARIAARPPGGRDLAAAKATHQDAGVYAMQGAPGASDGPEEQPMGASKATDAVLKRRSSGGAQKPQVRTDKKVGRNDPCPCGSGKKYKKCCGRE